ncbi:MAG TPA: M28 family peptidase, partial [Bryobacteraceae bacterium]
MAQTATIAAHARYPNSQGFFDAAEEVAARAREYGLQKVGIERFPQNEPMWDQQEAALTVTSSSQKIQAALAQHSADGDITAALVNADADHENLQGKVVLTDDEPAAAWRKLGKQGPAAIVSDAAGEYFGRRTLPDAILWSMAPRNVVALMISPHSGAALRKLLKSGGVTVHLVAKARRYSPGAIGMVMGEIPGAVSGQDIVIAAHLDHQFPGANDNASGSGTLLELVRTINHLIADGKIPKLHRSIRFWWTTEIDAEEAYFREHPEDAKNILLSIVLDQAGGERNAENNFIAILNPEWLPSYADDLIENLGNYLRDHYAPAE